MTHKNQVSTENSVLKNENVLSKKKENSESENINKERKKKNVKHSKLKAFAVKKCGCLMLKLWSGEKC